MTEDFGTSGCEKAFSPSEPPHPSGLSPLTGPKPRHLPQSYGSPLPSEHPTPYTGLDTNLIPPQPFYGVWPPPEHPPWRPTQMTTPNTPSASIPTSNARLFQGGSDNALNNSTASMANRDIWNLSNVHIHLPHALHDGQGPTSLPQLLRQPLSIFSYVLSTFATLIPHTSVTVDSQQYEAPYTMVPSIPPVVPPSVPASSCPDPNDLGSENNSTRAAEEIPPPAAEAVTTAFGSVEITLLDDLDMSARHQPRGWYRSPELPGGLSMDGIYIKKIYPSGHGYPCPNPCPLGPPVRIGDVGELTSTGFTTLANLFDCQIPALQTQLASLALSGVWHEPNYFKEGQSITGGVTVQKINYLPGSRVIQDITYRCRAPQGAILAVTSTAQLHTLTGDKTHRLRLWLCKYGMELLQFLEPGRTDPLYVVTGKVTSSSWANATYSESPSEPDTLVLTHFLDDLPPYQWTEPGASRNWSKSSSTVINSEGERASDQCLFLRGFLLTPASEYASRQAKDAVNIGDTAHDSATCKGHLNVDAAGGASGQGSSQSAHLPSSQNSGSARGSGQHDLLIEEIPSTSPLDFYPSHQINKRLLELTNADLAITHDDDWRLRLEGSRQTALSGLLQDISAAIAGNPGMTTADVNMHSDERLHRGEGDQASSGKQEEIQAAFIESFDKSKSSGSASRDKTVHHSGENADATEVPQRFTMLGKAAKDIEAVETAKPPHTRDRISSLPRRLSRPFPEVLPDDNTGDSLHSTSDDSNRDEGDPLTSEAERTEPPNLGSVRSQHEVSTISKEMGLHDRQSSPFISGMSVVPPSPDHSRPIGAFSKSPYSNRSEVSLVTAEGGPSGSGCDLSFDDLFDLEDLQSTGPLVRTDYDLTDYEGPSSASSLLMLSSSDHDYYNVVSPFFQVHRRQGARFDPQEGSAQSQQQTFATSTAGGTYSHPHGPYHGDSFLSASSGWMLPPPNRNDFTTLDNNLLLPSQSSQPSHGGQGHIRRGSCGSGSERGVRSEPWLTAFSGGSAGASPYPSPNASPRVQYNAELELDLEREDRIKIPAAGNSAGFENEALTGRVVGAGAGDAGLAGLLGPGGVGGHATHSPKSIDVNDFLGNASVTALNTLSAHGVSLGMGGGGMYVHHGSVDHKPPPVQMISEPRVTTLKTANANHKRRKQIPGFVCPFPGCGSTFTRSFNLKSHMRSHNEEKPFVCHWPGCGKDFMREHDCKRHEQLHTNYRPFTCEGCNRQFARMDALNRHLRSDGGAECAKLQSNGSQQETSDPSDPSNSELVTPAMQASGSQQGTPDLIYSNLATPAIQGNVILGTPDSSYSNSLLATPATPVTTLNPSPWPSKLSSFSLMEEIEEEN